MSTVYYGDYHGSYEQNELLRGRGKSSGFSDRFDII